MDTKGERKELQLRCLAKHCTKGKTWSGKVPIELVGAMTIMFHTGHEGHPLEIMYDGETWSTPT